jgi:hypothetical protein
MSLRATVGGIVQVGLNTRWLMRWLNTGVGRSTAPTMTGILSTAFPPSSAFSE